MRRTVRVGVGAALGITALAASAALVGPDQVVERATAVGAWSAAAVLAFLVAEALADSLGVWASVRPLNGGITPSESVQYAFAGDFFDTVSPAGPVTSEPIMAHFFGVATGTTYSEALGVRGAAKYVKSATQLLVSGLLVVALVAGGGAPRAVVVTLSGAVVALAVVGAVLVATRDALSRVLVVALTPAVRRLTALSREASLGRDAVAAAVDRVWSRALCFRDVPALLGAIALGGVLEQLLTAAALWAALAGTGTPVALLSVVAVVPLPQVASVVPVPASLGAYDVLLGGALVLTTGASPASAAAAVLLVRTLGLAVALGGGGLATGTLRGWRP